VLSLKTNAKAAVSLFWISERPFHHYNINYLAIFGEKLCISRSVMLVPVIA
jgi:hypothetical protein